MGLPQLPHRLVLGIADYLNLSDLKSLTQAHAHFHHALARSWYPVGVEHYDSTSLLWSTMHNDLPAAKWLLERGADVNTSAKSPGKTISAESSVRCMQKLLDCVMTELEFPDDKDSSTRVTPIALAAAAGHTDLVSLFLQYNADVSLSASFDYQPITLAAGAGHHEVVELLLKHEEANPIRVGYGKPAMYIASKNGHVNIVSLLLQHRVYDHGVDRSDSAISSSNPVDGEVYQVTPLMAAAKHGHPEVLRVLLEHSTSGIEAQDSERRTALALAAKWGHTDCVAILLDFGANPETMDSYPCTPLWIASRYGHTDTAALLLDRGASIEVENPEDPSGISPLLAALRAKHYDTALMLIKRGADPNVSDSYKETPIHLAVRDQQEALVRALLDRGATPNVNTTSGSNPLLCAVIRNNSTIVEMLLEAKIYPDMFGNCSRYKAVMPLVLAVRKGYKQIAELLLRHGANPGRAWKPSDHPSWRWNPLSGWGQICPFLMTVILHIPRKRPWMEQMAIMLVENGADSNSIDDNGNTPFFCAMITRSTVMMRLLLKFGADPYGIRNGRTVLDWAKKVGDPAVDAVLYENGIHRSCTHDPDDIHVNPWKPTTAI